MKNLTFSVILFLAVVSCWPAAETKAQSVSVSFSLFQQELSPYGRWTHHPRFGDVWIYGGRDFRPYYSNGHWEYSNYGWAWVSDFDWGWAPFHYGRWEYDDYYGWMWIPGYEWASAWVSWSSYDDYYGWAPLGFGVNINVSFGAIPYNNWIFIPRRNICDRDIYRYYVSPARDYRFRNAVCINNYYHEGRENRFCRGPERLEAERYTNRNISERRIDDRERQGRWYAGNDRVRENDRRNDIDNRRQEDERWRQNRDNDNQPGNGRWERNRNENNNNQQPNGGWGRKPDNSNDNRDNNNQSGNGRWERNRNDNNNNQQPNGGWGHKPDNSNDNHNNGQQTRENWPNRQNQGGGSQPRQVDRPVRDQHPQAPNRGWDNNQGRQGGTNNGNQGQLGNRGGGWGRRGG